MLSYIFNGDSQTYRIASSERARDIFIIFVFFFTSAAVSYTFFPCQHHSLCQLCLVYYL